MLLFTNAVDCITYNWYISAEDFIIPMIILYIIFLFYFIFFLVRLYLMYY